MLEIQILITAYGPDALEGIASLHHPENEKIEYLVSWQNYDKARIPESIKGRKDFKMFFLESKGLSNNRNNLFSKISAPFVVISDQDIQYSEKNIEDLLAALKEYRDYDILMFKYNALNNIKSYPPHSFDLKNWPKNYYIGSPEIGLNVENIRKKGKLPDLKFNPAFGINGKYFPCGEEDIFIHKLLKKGLRGRFVPVETCSHMASSSTSDRIGSSQQFIETKGAVTFYIHPFTWFLRMLAHAMRAMRETGPGHIPFFKYCRWWIKGLKLALKNRVFVDATSG